MTSFNIFCFGASLTEGLTWIGDNLAFTPYSQFLPDFLSSPQTNTIGSTMKFQIHNFGISGEETSEVRARFESFDSGNKRRNQNENAMFVFLAGTNDLAMSRSVDHAFENMNSMIRDCCSNEKHQVEVCSIPSTAQIEDSDLNLYFSSFSSSSLISRRNEYNLRLKKLCQELGGGKAQFFDLFGASGVKLQLSDDAESDKHTIIKLNPEFASDNIHLNPAGYKMLARGVADAIEKLLSFDMTPPTGDGSGCSKI